jgi:HSP20 family molecular chaperone IbpA
MGSKPLRDRINEEDSLKKEVNPMAAKEKRLVVPMVSVTHNESDTGLLIEVDLAGAQKESVALEMGDAGFCVKGDAEDFRYETCYMLAHEIKPRETKAKFDSGLLRIEVPFRDMLRGHKVAIK